MTTMANAPARVEAVPQQPRRFGILDAAIVIDDPSAHWQMGYEYIPDSCATVSFDAGSCHQTLRVQGGVEANIDAARTITIDPVGSAPTSGLRVDWGDGNTDSDVALPATHTYAANGEYTVVLSELTTGWSSTLNVFTTTGAVSGPFETIGTIPKTGIDGLPVATGYPFNVYSMHLCRPVGNDQARTRAARNLELGEQEGVAEMVIRLLNLSPDLQDATPIVGAGVPVMIADALANIENALLDTYNGVGVILMSAASATILADRLAIRNGRLETIIGTPVGLFGTGITPPFGETTAGQGWIYGVGGLVLRRGTVNTYGPVVDPATNDQVALAERPYGVSWECTPYAAKGYRRTCCGSAGAADPQSGTTLVLTLGSIPASPVPDGTDTTLVVQANIAPTDEVFIHYSINGGPWQITPELTEVTPTQFVHNVVGDQTGPGDSVEMFARSGSTDSNHITIEVT